MNEMIMKMDEIDKVKPFFILFDIPKGPLV